MRKIRLISAILAGAIFSFTPAYHAMCVDYMGAGSSLQHSTMTSQRTQISESEIIIPFASAAHSAMHCLGALMGDSTTNKADSMEFVIYLLPAILGFFWFLIGILQRRYKYIFYSKIRHYLVVARWTFVDYKNVSLHFISISRT